MNLPIEKANNEGYMKDPSTDSIVYRQTQIGPRIFVTPAVNVALIMQSIAGTVSFNGGGSTEVSSITACVPCDESGLEFDPDVNNYASGPIMPSHNFPNLMLLATAFIPQEGNSASTEYDIKDFIRIADEKFSKSYEFLKAENNVGNRFGTFWTHTHPTGYGTLPSNVDYTTFEKHTRYLPLFNMFIIDKRLHTVGFDAVKDVTNRMCMRNITTTNGIFKVNAYIESIIFCNHRQRQDMQIIGLGLSYLYATYPHIYNDIVSGKPNPDGYDVYDVYGEELIHVPGVKQIQGMVTPTVTYTKGGNHSYGPHKGNPKGVKEITKTVFGKNNHKKDEPEDNSSFFKLIK